MLQQTTNVRTNFPLLTETLFMTLVSGAVRKVQLKNELSDRDLAQLIGCKSGSTVNNASNRLGKLQGHTLFNLLNVDEYALEGLLQFYGRRSVPIEAKCDTDELVSTSAAVHKIAEAYSHRSKTPGTIDDDECLELEPYVEDAIRALLKVQQRAMEIRRDRAA